MSSTTEGGDPFRKFIITLSRSRFFTVSLFIHILVIVLFGGTVLFQAVQEPPDFEGAGGGGFIDPVQVAQPPTTQTNLQTNPQIKPVNTTAAPTIKAITTINPSGANFAIPQIAPKIRPSTQKLTEAAAPELPKVGAAGLTRDAAMGIKQFTQGWGKGQSGMGTGGGLRQRQFEFTAYIAKYSGGDWDSTVELNQNNGRIIRGSLPNLLYIMKKWSSDRIDAKPNAIPLNLATDELFSAKPPFVIFTGHQDFKLTDQEVQNLQKYIRLGGAIWGDSSLAGRNSRFDIAFRRQMKRVIPDVDKEFEPLDPEHPIYTNGYWQEITEIVPGMNFYTEPIYAMRIYGEIAIFYTANNYNGMWEIGIMENGEYDTRRREDGQFVAINPTVFQNRDLYFRNLTPPALVDSYKFGTNIVLHLLTRWEDKLRAVPNL